MNKKKFIKFIQDAGGIGKPCSEEMVRKMFKNACEDIVPVTGPLSHIVSLDCANFTDTKLTAAQVMRAHAEMRFRTGVADAGREFQDFIGKFKPLGADR